MKVFLTGGTGFLGSHILDFLVQEKNIDQINLPIRDASSLKKVTLDPKIKLFKINWKSQKDILKSLESSDLVIHSAAVITSNNVKDFYLGNTILTERLLEACKIQKIKKFIFISSQSVSGPIKEKNHVFDEDMQVYPKGHYAKSKFLAENVVLNYKDIFEVIILRPSAIYGPRDDMLYEAVIKPLVNYKLIISLGLKKNPIYFNIIFVKDLADIIVKISLSKKIKTGSIFFINDGKIYTWNDIIPLIIKLSKIRYYFHLKVPFIFLKLFKKIITTIHSFFVKIDKKHVLFSLNQKMILYSNIYLASNKKIENKIHYSYISPEKGIEEVFFSLRDKKN